MHIYGIMHNDLKEKNILVGRKYIKISDFGTSQESLSTTGTLDYIAPERKKNISNGNLNIICDEKCDIYSLGIILTNLFHKETRVGYSDGFDFIQEVKQSGIRRRYKRLIKKMLKEDPEQRVDLESVLENKKVFKEQIKKYKKIRDLIENDKETNSKDWLFF